MRATLMLLLLSVCLAACWAPLAADEKEKDEKEKAKSGPTVEVVSVHVDHKVDARLAEQFAYGEREDRTEVGLLLRLPGKPLIGLHQDSAVTSAKDDKGNDLVVKSPERKTSIRWSTAVDRSAVLATVALGAAPGKGASKVLIKGELFLIYGTEEKSEEAEKFTFESGAKAKAGKFELAVQQEKGFRGGPEVTVTSPNFRRNVVKALAVQDGDGKDVEAVSVPVLDFGFGGWKADFALKKPLKQGKLKLTYFSKSEAVTAPFDLSVGLGDLSD